MAPQDLTLLQHPISFSVSVYITSSSLCKFVSIFTSGVQRWNSKWRVFGNLARILAAVWCQVTQCHVISIQYWHEKAMCIIIVRVTIVSSIYVTKRCCKDNKNHDNNEDKVLHLFLSTNFLSSSVVTERRKMIGVHWYVLRHVSDWSKSERTREWDRLDRSVQWAGILNAHRVWWETGSEETQSETGSIENIKEQSILSIDWGGKKCILHVELKVLLRFKKKNQS